MYHIRRNFSTYFLSGGSVGAEILCHHLPFVQVVLNAANLLVCLMPLARQDNHVSRPALIQRPGDGRPAVRLHVDNTLRPLHTGQNIGDDVAGDLGTGIVGGDHG